MLALVAALGARSGCGFAPPPRTGRFHSFAGRHPSDDDARQTKRGMFTGIVEEMGEVVSLETRNDMTLWDGSKGKGTEMVIKGDVVMDGAYLGCSIRYVSPASMQVLSDHDFGLGDLLGTLLLTL